MYPLTIFYDNWCVYCTRFAYFVKRQDFLHKIILKPIRNEENLNFFNENDKKKAIEQMASFNGEKFFYGYDSIFLIFKRLPVFWVLFPIFFLLKITGLGQIIYKEFAIRRKIIPLHCDKNNCSL